MGCAHYVVPAVLSTWIPSNNPHYRVSAIGVYELPFGRDRRYLANLPAVVNAALSGWSVSSLLLLNTGDYLCFAAMVAGDDPAVSNPTMARWFNTAKFAVLPPYTPRTNPWQYASLTGPASWNWTPHFEKVRLTECFNLEFRVKPYNLTNSFVPKDPVVDVMSSAFGRSTDQANRGREMQYTLRLHF